MDLHQSANLDWNLYRACDPAGIWIMIEKSSAGKQIMYIHISGWHTICFGAMSSPTVSRWRRWHSGPRWRRSWWRCTSSFAPPECPWILCCANLAKKMAVRLIFLNHCWVSFYRSLHHVMPVKHNTPLLLFSNLGVLFLDYLLCFLTCGAQKPFFSQCGHIQGKMHVRLFKLYPTSLFYHSSWHVENLQEISCCF